MDEAIKLLWKNKMHPEIYNSNIPWKQKLFLQDQLEHKHKGDFIALLTDILEYALLSDIEDYESAIEIRDYIKDLKD
jgi:protein-arginine kinase activator protein McsA